MLNQLSTLYEIVFVDSKGTDYLGREKLVEEAKTHVRLNLLLV